mgnify:CR=1 FL=1
MNRPLASLATVVLLTACAGLPRADRTTDAMFSAQRTTDHRGTDDLLTAGLGIAGLRQPIAPAFAVADAPTAAELRRRAIWTNWRGIADLVPGGGFGDWYGSVAAVPGREFHAFARVPGATHPHRVMVQLPDAFDAARRCVVVTASSGSRGVYGAIAVAGAWGLPKGCAVAYTDKGAGTDYFDLDAGQGVAPDGTRVDAGDAALAFAPDAPTGPAGVRGVAFKHAHSGDNPEADWGRHVRQAADFALQVLNEARPGDAPFTHANTRVIAVGISNGGGAVLRAAEAGMAMDEATRASLEILESTTGGRAGSLIGAVDRCVTGAGSRLLAEDLSAPLLDVGMIEARLALVQFWHERPIERAQLREILRAIPDLGRALGRVVAGRGSPRDLGQLRDGLSEAARLHHWLSGAPDKPALLDAVLARLTGHGALTDWLARALVPTPPTERGNGGYIADGYDAALDELRATSGDARRAIAAMEARYRDETGIATLKIRHNGVLGYFIEVAARHADALMAPDSGFTHRQTMAGAVRFNSLKLHEEAARIAEAGGHALAADGTASQRADAAKRPEGALSGLSLRA